MPSMKHILVLGAVALFAVLAGGCSHNDDAPTTPPAGVAPANAQNPGTGGPVPGGTPGTVRTTP